MRRALSPVLAVVAAALLHSPVSLIAGEGGGARALIPMSEVPVTGDAPAPNGAVEAPTEPVPAAPVPAEAPQLVPPDQVGAETAPAPAPTPAPAPAVPPEPAPQLRPQAELAQETVPEAPVPDETPSETPAGRGPDGETDPEEFEEDFDVPARPTPEPPDATGGTEPVTAGERLPETGTDLTALAGVGLSLLAFGLSLRRVRPAPRRPRARPVRKLPSAHAHARALRPPFGANYGLPAHRWVFPPLR